MKNFGKVAVRVVRESRRAHCAVICAIAQLSCYILGLGINETDNLLNC